MSAVFVGNERDSCEVLIKLGIFWIFLNIEMDVASEWKGVLKSALFGVQSHLDTVEPRYSAKNFWSLQQENLQN
jgi:hypothetical protein